MADVENLAEQYADRPYEVDVESVLQKVPSVDKPEGVPTRELKPGMIVAAPDPRDPTGVRTRLRKIEVAYEYNTPTNPGSREMTSGQWRVWFADLERPMGYATTDDRLWKVEGQ